MQPRNIVFFSTSLLTLTAMTKRSSELLSEQRSRGAPEMLSSVCFYTVTSKAFACFETKRYFRRKKGRKTSRGKVGETAFFPGGQKYLNSYAELTRLYDTNGPEPPPAPIHY